MGAPDLRRYVGRSRGEHIPEVGTTRLFAPIGAIGGGLTLADVVRLVCAMRSGGRRLDFMGLV